MTKDDFSAVLDKKLSAIKKEFKEEVQKSEQRLGKKITNEVQKSEQRLGKKITNEVQKTEQRLGKKITNEVWLAEQRLEEKIETKIETPFYNYRSDIMDRLDTIAGGIQKHDEEHTIHQGQHDRLEDIPERVDKLEEIHPKGHHLH